MSLALLHTSPRHVPVFDALRDADHQGLELRHFVDEELLSRARAEGPEAVRDDVRAALERAVALGARVVLCTCSSIGGVAEAAAPAVGVPVLRVDRPMASAAVAVGPRIVVLATVESTLGPTAALIEEEARRVGRPVAVRGRLVAGAWQCFEAGDMGGSLRLVAAAADEEADADVIVLAQVSTASAQHLMATTIPVLSSPRLGLAAGAEAMAVGRSSSGRGAGE
ncbi:aspartate/glutamate racemase family protein [Streptomyces sp. NBC_01231]|nr:aspartate/glutamate racemase family protein [Streptomyces sp. NBC_01231]